MTFDTRKILPISLERFLSVTGKKSTDYELEGVHDTRQYMGVKTIGGVIHWENPEDDLDLTKHFAKKVPKKTEVVVDYEFNAIGIGSATESTQYQSYLIYQRGIALIPRKKIRR